MRDNRRALTSKAKKRTPANAHAAGGKTQPGTGPHDNIMAVQEVLKPLLRTKAPDVYRDKGLNGVMDVDYGYGQLDFMDLLDREIPQGLARNGYTFPGAPDQIFIDKYLHLTGIGLVPAVAARTTSP